jgi:hypothetical protein
MNSFLPIRAAAWLVVGGILLATCGAADNSLSTVDKIVPPTTSEEKAGGGKSSLRDRLAILANTDAFPAELVGIQGTEITFQSAVDGSIQSSVDGANLVRWSHPVEAGKQLLVVLSDGSLLAAAESWAARDIVRLENGSLVVRTKSLGQARIPREYVTAVIPVPPADPRDRLMLIDRLRRQEEPRDHVFLTSGDQLEGRVADLNSRLLQLERAEANSEFALTEVQAVAFDHRLVRRPNATPALTIGLQDGSLLHVSVAEVAPLSSQFTLACGVKLGGAGVADVAAVWGVAGAFQFVSDLEPIDYHHVPYLDLTWPLARDRNLSGDRLRVDGKSYPKGICMHSAARVVYSLEARQRRFAAEVALDDEAGRRGSVTFSVYVARNGAWLEAATSGIVRGGDEPRPMVADVSGAEALMLVVDYADRGDELDRAVWLDARLE